MRTIKFPKMFNTNSTRVWKSSEHLEATKQSTKLLLQTVRGELFGDPYFGVTLKKYLFDQNNYVLRDALIDIIYTQLVLFIPQLYIKRKDIEIIQDHKKGYLVCKFSGLNQIDYTVNTFDLALLEDK
jgi:phage baseplate assembly protein W